MSEENKQLDINDVGVNEEEIGVQVIGPPPGLDPVTQHVSQQVLSSPVHVQQPQHPIQYIQAPPPSPAPMPSQVPGPNPYQTQYYQGYGYPTPSPYGRNTSVQYLPQNQKPVYNNWTEGNERTINAWVKDITHDTNLYQGILNKKKGQLDNINLAILIISSVAALLSALKFSFDNDKYKEINTAFEITNVVMVSTIAFLGNYVKNKGLDESVQKLVQYIEKLDHFYNTVSSIQMLGPKLREDAIEFIKREDPIYRKLQLDAPPLNEVMRPTNVPVQNGGGNRYRENNSVLEMA